MKKSIILQIASQYFISLTLLYSFFLLIRGHHFIGGGFSGGLAAGSAFCICSVAYSRSELLATLRVHPMVIVSLGLLISILSGLLSMIKLNRPYLTGVWGQIPLATGPYLSVGSPLFFDLGVYLVVLGTILVLIIEMKEEG